MNSCKYMLGLYTHQSLFSSNCFYYIHASNYGWHLALINRSLTSRHEFNLKKMPECWFYQRQGECINPECQYLHIDPASKMKECTWYSRGFCIHGSSCRGKHIRKGVCQNYLSGFCPKGPDCPLGQ